ncbi:trypsin-like peptidase domain-containing protein [uncultured Allobaculum sp.]|uniref:trypsin-like peptidase domain-containing protein n=1 Tax=uncultured Allobaculum sp. TaxID=1187017 RepID=UPI0025830C41|nr:trypsin-like peptidase domain-containing protein [uncultured Allobaculum sp.]
MKKMKTGLAALALAMSMHIPAISAVQAQESPDLLASHSQTIEGQNGLETAVHVTDEPEDYSVKPQASIDEIENIPESAVKVPRKVIGEDDRYLIARTDVAPYNAICNLTITFSNGGVYSGTGFLIAPDTILTAGHCVFDHDNNMGWARSIVAVPGGKDPSNPDNQYSSKLLMAPPDWTKTGASNTDYDLGLIRLRKPIEGVEPLKLATLDQANLDKTYELAGYPYNENISLESQGMYGAKGRLHSMTGRRTVLHTIDSSSGQSGAPLLNENNQVEAIHTFAKASEQLNGGVAIDSYIYAYVASYAAIDEPVYRLYNPNSGEHLYTTEYNELVNCINYGWKDEGVAWHSEKNGVPLYRLYNPNAGDHHYTLDTAERAALVEMGWTAEGITCYTSASENDRPVYRLYNPNAVAGSHHFTFNATERDGLVTMGWVDEGIGFYSK